MKRPLITILLLGTSISLIAPLPQWLLIICGAIQAFVVPGLAFIGLAGQRGRPRTDDLFFPLLLSPVLMTVSVLAAARIVPETRSAATAAWFWYAMLALSVAVRRSEGAAQTRPGTGEASVPGVPRSVVLLSLAYGAVVLVAYLSNHFLLWRSDAWYHASVTAEILERGFPPGEPWIAGVPIRYMWFYHLFIASWMRLSGLPLIPALGGLNVACAAAFPYVVGRFAGMLTGDRRKVFLATLLTVAGFESASWILWPVGLGRALFGEVRGADEIARALALVRTQLNDIEVIRFLRPYGTYMINLTDKFLTVTPFSYSLSLLMLALVTACSRSWRRTAPFGAFLFSFIAILGAFLFHVITGAALIGAAVGAGILSAAAAGVSHSGPVLPRSRLVLPAAAIAAAAVGAPYFISLGAGGPASGGIAGLLHLGLKNTLTLLIPLVLLGVPSLRALRGLLHPDGAGRETARWWALCLLLLCVFVNLPTRNESKLIYPLFLVIAPLVMIETLSLIGSLRGIRRGLLIAWVVLLYLPPPLLTFRGFMIAEPRDPVDRRREEAMKDDTFYRWVKEHTAVDAVIAEPGHDHLMPVLARRRSLASRGGVLDVVGYGSEEVRRCQDLQDGIFDPEGPESVAGAVVKTGFDLYVFVPRDAGALPDGTPRRLIRSVLFTTVYEYDGNILLRPRHEPRREGDG